MAIKKKDVKIQVPLTTDQKERWESFADERDMSLSSFVRNCVEAYISASEKIRKLKENG